MLRAAVRSAAFRSRLASPDPPPSPGRFRPPAPPATPSRASFGRLSMSDSAGLTAVGRLVTVSGDGVSASSRHTRRTAADERRPDRAPCAGIPRLPPGSVLSNLPPFGPSFPRIPILLSREPAPQSAWPVGGDGARRMSRVYVPPGPSRTSGLPADALPRAVGSPVWLCRDRSSERLRSPRALFSPQTVSPVANAVASAARTAA